ncbi:hypothetical protein [Coleofasciculus sp. FACHB-1120]|uniref:hypothetical protein n=1 Tax=Coleofasciculus sp. FACHB-1120 TaxID=2692783 RepID=UPI0016842478|nr:hypothetical protein [Coleofasciculus sp. FACHB-1120]MBD2741599.1 hypothetical protein [Coleofasciculus sp. FACHB-1120]
MTHIPAFSISASHSDSLTSWESVGAGVEFLFMAGYDCQERGWSIDKNLDRNNSGSLRIAEPKLNKQSGRYRLKVAVPT